MKTVIHIPGKLRVPGVSQGIEEYRKRVTDWSLELAQGYPDPDESRALVGLDPGGTMTTTEGLNKWLNQTATSGKKSVHFLIGGKEGLDKTYLARSSWTWSLGPLILNQSIAALVVAEQCYRCFALRTGHPYHQS